MKKSGVLIIALFAVAAFGVPFAVLPASGATFTLESGINGTTYTLEGEAGTAGIVGTDYALGTYLSGGNGLLGHGFEGAYGWTPGFVAPLPPSGATAAGAMEAADLNWLQGTTHAIVVDTGANAADQAIVFNSIDHLGVPATVYGDAEKDLWNAVIEGIEFTVYGSNDLADATAVGTTAGVFGTAETGLVPGAGVGSTFEQGALDYVFLDGHTDYGNANESDDFASVWQFSQDYQYIAVYSNLTDPFIGDGFQSGDNELDAIGTFLTPVGSDPIPEPTTMLLFGSGLIGIAAYRRFKKSA